jgi:hypothetical protein
LSALSDQDLSAILELLPPFSQLLQADDLGLIGVNETDLFTLEAAELGFPLRTFGTRCCGPIAGSANERLELGPQRRRVVEQPPDVAPHGGVQLVCLHHRPCAP